jgi:hypothetical protein
MTYELVWLRLSVSCLGRPTAKRKAVPYCCKHFRMLETYVHSTGPARYLCRDDPSLPELARQGRFSDIFQDIKGVTAGKAVLLPLMFGFLMAYNGPPWREGGRLAVERKGGRFLG